MTIDINGAKLEINALNVTEAAAYEEAVKHLGEKVEELQRKGNIGLTECLQTQLNIAAEFLDETFGNGAAVAALGENKDLEIALNAVYTVREAVDAQIEDVNKKYASKFNSNVVRFSK